MDAESTWFDAGTHESYLAASVFVEMVQTERSIQIGCLEEAAYRRRLITANQLLVLSQQSTNSYGTYLRGLALDSLYGSPKHLECDPYDAHAPHPNTIARSPSDRTASD